MFFIFGINNGREDLDYNELRICKVCGSYGRYEGYIEQNQFSLFFLPIFKWNKRYFVRANCCGSIFSISDSCGRDLEYGRKNLRDEDLHLVYTNYKKTLRCPHCGYELKEPLNFCPNCGGKI